MNIFCMLMVTIGMGNINVIQEVQATGTLLRTSSYYYLVDFSKQAKEENWIGDHSKQLVSKSECMELGK